jgi:hypothetical protein
MVSRVWCLSFRCHTLLFVFQGLGPQAMVTVNSGAQHGKLLENKSVK